MHRSTDQKQNAQEHLHIFQVHAFVSQVPPLSVHSLQTGKKWLPDNNPIHLKEGKIVHILPTINK